MTASQTTSPAGGDNIHITTNRATHDIPAGLGEKIAEDITGEKSLYSSASSEDDLKDELIQNEKPIATRFTLDPSGPLTHDLTTVDIVTVPCPGGHPLKSWSRDGLLSRYFGAPSMRDAEANQSRHCDTHNSNETSSSGASADGRQSSSWVRQGIRREADKARILLYEHPDVEDDTTLDALAAELLEQLQGLRETEGRERPLFFFGHSVGGLVVKMALVQADQSPRYQNILKECYGVGFFGTPHQGSSYFAMPSLMGSIQSRLQLSKPLPTSITNDLRVGNSVLLHVDERFKDLSNDLRVWTFYETIDSRLSGNGSGDVYFTAPLTSIKSAILGMRQEHIFPLQSDHANIASFGRHNVHTLRMFLKQLAVQIAKADANASDIGGRWTLSLEQKVNIEVHGFFEDPVGPDATDTAVRAWSTKLPLRDFLKKGPDVCLVERLNEVNGAPEETQFLRKRGRTARGTEEITDNQGLGIMGYTGLARMSMPASPVIRAVDAAPRPKTESAPAGSTAQAVAVHTSPPSRFSTPMRKPSPLIRADFDQDLAIDRLSPPLRPRVGRTVSRSFSDGSRFEYRDFPPFSQRSQSLVYSPTSDGADVDADIDDQAQLPEPVVAIRKEVQNQKKRVSETVVVDEVPVAFVKPQAKSRKFVWLHLPYNNPTWVKAVLETLQECYKKDLSSLYSHDFWQTRHSRGRHSQHYAYFAKPGCYFTAPRTLSPRHTGATSLSTSSIEQGMYTCLFLPYLHFDSYKRLVRRRDLILRRIQHGRAQPIPDQVAKSDSIELQVIWEFLGHDPPINCRRTIDQFGYPSLRDTRSRDDDQMLYKLTKERTLSRDEERNLYNQGSSTADGSSTSGSWKVDASESNNNKEEDVQDNVLNGNVLMVDQLWLWVVNTDTIFSLFPKRESDPIEGPLYQQADLRDSIFNEVNVDLTRQCDNALDLAALAALHAVSVLIDRSSHPDLEVFRIFEEAISVLTEKLTSSLKDFRRDGFRDKALEYDDIENKARSIRARHREEGHRAEADNRDNTSALLELRDIEDELLILTQLFDRQSKVLSSMYAIYARPELRDWTANGRVFLAEASKRVGEYSHTANEMLKRVRNTRDEYDKLLQMVQRQAQVDEVRLSRLHADLASAQSRSVMIFTTFTVIFLPLSFFTSLFGMNTREWGGGDNLSIKTIGTIALPSSFVLVVASLLIAWSTTVRRFFQGVSHAWSNGVDYAYDVLWMPIKEVTSRGWQALLARLALLWTSREDGDDGSYRGATGSYRNGRADGSESKSDRKNLKKETSDFWQRHRLERERGYVIPEVNRKREMGGKGRSRRRDR